MREIKFRAWHESTGMEYDIYPPVKVPLMQYTGLKDKDGVEIYEGDVIKVTTEFYGVFKNKVDYYTGVFGYMNMNSICVENKKGWNKDYDQVNSGWFAGGFSALNGDGYAKHKDVNNIEVIGNIYENPELLKT